MVNRLDSGLSNEEVESASREGVGRALNPEFIRDLAPHFYSVIQESGRVCATQLIEAGSDPKEVAAMLERFGGPFVSLESGAKALDKDSLLEEMEDELKSTDAPPQFTRCVVNRLDSGLSNAEVERASREGLGAAMLEPQIAKKLAPHLLAVNERSFRTCAAQVVEEGGDPQELISALERLETP